MTAKMILIISGIVFWSFGLFTVVQYHSQYDHKKISAEYPNEGKPIEVTAPRNSFVELE